MPVWLALLLATFATQRLTRLVVIDSITDPIRTWLAIHLPLSLSELVVCSWCAGFWVAGFVVAGSDLGLAYLPSRWWILFAWPAVAGLAGLIARFDGPHEADDYSPFGVQNGDWPPTS